MRRIIVGLNALLMLSAAQAVDQIYVQGGALVRPAGKTFPDDVEAGLAWTLPWQWDGGRLSSRLNIALGYTDGKSHSSWRTLAMPALRYQTSVGDRGVFAELGIGVSYLSHAQWASGHDLGSHLQFMERLGIGYRFGKNELGLNLTHVSNGGFEQPNPGAEIVSIRFAHDF